MTLLGTRGKWLERWLGPDGIGLELGCGTGLLASWLDDCGVDRARLFGIDLSQGMLERAVGRGLGVVRGDMDRLPFVDGAFRVVLAFTSLRLLEQESRTALRESARVLAPGGRLVVSLLRHDWDAGFERELVEAGFDPGSRRECGQDYGYVCRRRG
jgi:ubiquinone/menaquinone biosynthesis C-methylase UbiE